MCSVSERNVILSSRQLEAEEQVERERETMHSAELEAEMRKETQKRKDIQAELIKLKGFLESASVLPGHSIQESLQDMHSKIVNFRAMLDRRNRRIEKLERKPGIVKSKQGEESDRTDLR